MGISATTQGARWLARFPDGEASIARDLIDEVLLVSRDGFTSGLRGILDNLCNHRTSNGKHRTQLPLALYAEREVVKEDSKILPFFPNSERGRALGGGVPPIVTDPLHQEVGSEGIVANFITDFCRSQGPHVALNHPGPDELRSGKARTIVVVTDFIGSGKRIFEMLEAFRYVATLRSWHHTG